MDRCSASSLLAAIARPAVRNETGTIRVSLDDGQTLRAKAREKLESGTLPVDDHVRVWGGRGANQPCALCDIPISPDDIEYELELRRRSELHTYRFHRRCLAIWELERGRRQ